MNIKTIKLLLLLICFAGCVTENDHFAKVRKLSNLDPALNEKVLGHIRFLEDANGRKGCPIEILRVEARGEELRAFVEFWVVRRCGVKTVYKVRKTPLGRDQFKYIVTYPSAADLMSVSE